VTNSSRNASIVGALGSTVELFDGATYLLYLSGIDGTKFGSRSMAPAPEPWKRSGGSREEES
jgi:hypothetical protein